MSTDELSAETDAKLVNEETRGAAQPATWLRVSGLIVMLAAFLAALHPALPMVDLQVLLLAGVLIGSACFGLSIGLSAATVGFALILWRHLEVAGSLGVRAIIDAIVWFAVAKFAAALIALQRRQFLRHRAARQQSDESAKQKSLLLAEMTHRMRNDMHRLIGMLNAQASSDPQAASALRQAANRVLVLTRLHERLAVRGSETLIDSGIFLNELGSDLRSVMEPGRLVGLAISAESHLVTPSVAADVGLIVNELVTNALKHGFPKSASGVIRVVFRRIDEMFELMVTDNGVGSTGDQATEGLGRQLLQALAAQLGGRIFMSRGEVGGTQCRLMFPLHIPSAAGSITVATLDGPERRGPLVDQAPTGTGH